VVKNLPFADTSAQPYFFGYDTDTTNKTHSEEVTTMRHYYFRLILGILFLVCMIFCFITANIPFALLYLMLGGMFSLSARSLHKKSSEEKE